MRDHRKLRAFQLADEMAIAVYVATSSFPRCERFGLTSQIRRSAVSVPSCIVEGCARRTEADNLRFLDMTFGSCRELGYQLSLASRLGFIAQHVDQPLADLNEQTATVLNGLLRALRS